MKESEREPMGMGERVCGHDRQTQTQGQRQRRQKREREGGQTGTERKTQSVCKKTGTEKDLER